jgi:hypothetical protein
MTESISSANDAASTLFLGHNGEWWDFWLIVSVIIAALAAAGVGVATAGSIISHKREAKAAEEALDLYKLETRKKISEADARTKQAELELQKRTNPRFIAPDDLKAALAGKPTAKPEIWSPNVLTVNGLRFGYSQVGKAGWDIGNIKPQPLPPPPLGTVPLSSAVSKGGQMWNVSILSKNMAPGSLKKYGSRFSGP